MIDTEPYNPSEVTAPRLTKLLLGGINRKVDKNEKPAVQPVEVPIEMPIEMPIPTPVEPSAEKPF